MSDDSQVPSECSYTENGDFALCYNSKFMLSMPEVNLMLYCQYIFEMLSETSFISRVFKESDSSVLESTTGVKARYAYGTNMAFRANEQISMLQITAMYAVLKKNGRSIENAIMKFYNEYLKERYNYPSLPMKLASENTDWIEKIRILLPEFESVVHQYNLFAENKDIDVELLQIASPIKLTDVKSTVDNRYYIMNGQPEELQRLFGIFFSNQSMLTYIDSHKDVYYENFFDMMVNERDLQYNDFLDSQKNRLEYVISNGYIKINKLGNIELVKTEEVLLLKQLYEYHACSYWLYDEKSRGILDDMKKNGWLIADNHLLSQKERDYFSYYLNNEKYTNGPALRNKYDHGAIGHYADKDQHEKNYYCLLYLFILYLLKIDADLSIKRYLERK